MKKEKEYKIRKFTIYIQYYFMHIGLAIDYEKYGDHHNLSFLLPFFVIAIEFPIIKN